MKDVIATVSCEVHFGGEISSPRNDRQADTMSLNNFEGSSLNPLPLRTEEDTTVSPYSLSLRDAETPASMVAPRADPCQILKDGIGRAFQRQVLAYRIGRAFSDTADDIDDGLWAMVRSGLPNMTPQEAREIWQTIANIVAVDCFDANEKVDVERLRVWMELFGNMETFKTEPFCFIPNVELMRSQIYGVCECLILDRNDARSLLNDAKDIIVGEYGGSTLAAISQGRQQSLKPGEAILASLFAPHRQWSLPTCAIDSLTNAEIRNHPERLIKMYIQILKGDQIILPSGYVILLQQVKDNYITVDLKNGGKGRDEVFRAIRSGDSDELNQQIEMWEQTGIKYVESTDPAEQYKLKLPIHNMNDVLFAHLFLASNFGNKKINDHCSYGSIEIYTGNKGEVERCSSTIQVDDSNFLNVIEALKKEAEVQRQLGHRYMCVHTEESREADVYLYHAENIDIDLLLALDPDNMEIERAYPIGDRNWSGRMSRDIPRLAVRKVATRRMFGISSMLRLLGRTVNDTSTYEFGILRGSRFKKKNISTFSIFSTEIRSFGSLHFSSHFKNLFRKLLLVSYLIGINTGFLHLILLIPISNRLFRISLSLFYYLGFIIGLFRLTSSISLPL
ncbi:MAG: hypothetical protein LBC11_01955 [Puniceicoccales bacterium]|jgi:hypothetical protein|nr:hypothetical protein [Puniceicoccales bacterium]